MIACRVFGGELSRCLSFSIRGARSKPFEGSLWVVGGVLLLLFLVVGGRWPSAPNLESSMLRGRPCVCVVAEIDISPISRYGALLWLHGLLPLSLVVCFGQTKTEYL